MPHSSLVLKVSYLSINEIAGAKRASDAQPHITPVPANCMHVAIIFIIHHIWEGAL